MKIVVLDGFAENPGDLSWGPIEELGELTIYDRTPVDDTKTIINRIGDAEIVLTNKTPITKEVIDACTSVKYIGVLATGYNVIDFVYARKKSIPVVNIPSYGTAAVGQFAIAMLLEICHNVGHHSKAVHEGRWTSNSDWCFWDYPLIELSEKVMGIIGYGKIGQTTGKIAQALGMKVLAYDTYKNTDLISDTLQYVEIEELLKEADVIALHCPLFAETEGIINKENISKMKDGVIILNNSRGPLIVEEDLSEALNSGKVYAAALDVVSTEPIKADNPLLSAKNCIITPHISWASKESRQRIMNMAAENIIAFIKGNPINVQN